VEHEPARQFVTCAVTEYAGGAPDPQGHQHRPVRDDPERKDRSTIRQRRYLVAQVGVAATYFRQGRLVLGRQALYCIGDAAIPQLETIARVGGSGAVGQAETV